MKVAPGGYELSMWLAEGEGRSVFSIAKNPRWLRPYDQFNVHPDLVERTRWRCEICGPKGVVIGEGPTADAAMLAAVREESTRG